jgi:drug/metabolite transporter (DMT)-like permease
MFYFFQILLASFLGAAGQIFFKIGAKTLTGGLFNTILSFLTNKFLFIGLMLYGISTLIYVTTLKHVSLTVAYPTIATSYIVVILLSYLFLGEPLSFYKVIGTIIILIGVIILWIK